MVEQLRMLESRRQDAASLGLDLAVYLGDVPAEGPDLAVRPVVLAVLAAVFVLLVLVFAVVVVVTAASAARQGAAAVLGSGVVDAAILWVRVGSERLFPLRLDEESDVAVPGRASDVGPVGVPG